VTLSLRARNSPLDKWGARHSPPKLPLPVERFPKPNYVPQPLAHPTYHPKRHPYHISRLPTIYDRQTHRQTDRLTDGWRECSITRVRSCSIETSRPNNTIQYTRLDYDTSRKKPKASQTNIRTAHLLMNITVHNCCTQHSTAQTCDNLC